MNALRDWVRRSALYDLSRRMQQRWQFVRWQAAGGTAVPPPHLIKQRIIRDHARVFGARVLVETGTYLGDMIFAMRNDFASLHSIELSQELHARAQRRFAAHHHVMLHQGDSATVLPKILPTIHGPCLFWLDGHYSAGVTAKGAKDTPVAEELAQIFSRPDLARVVLIDDARCFNGTGDYPTLEDIRSLVRARRSDWVVDVGQDVIRVHPPRKAL